MVLSGLLIFKVALPVLVPSAASPALRIAHSIPVIDSDLLGLYAAAIADSPTPMESTSEEAYEKVKDQSEHD
jgi:hypothetical protein